jgi:DNA-binding transcriptional regulator YdaS (Cro superfamily)
MQTKRLITLLGGSTFVGRQLNIRPQAVSLWIAADRVPVARVPALVRMARGQGVDLRPEMLRNDIDWGGLA